jgi:partner of Y14 and mago
MPPKETNSTSSGIVVDTVTGQRHVPASVRSDGSTRREIRIRPGYRPPEDIEKYKNRTAEAWRSRGSGGVPGAEVADADETNQSGAPASSKNAKKREAKKRAKAAIDTGDGIDIQNNDVKDPEPEPLKNKAGETASTTGPPQPDGVVTPEAEKEKKVRSLKKKLRQARELRDKKDKGESLLPEQFEKAIKVNELIRQLETLGFDADGEPVITP